MSTGEAQSAYQAAGARRDAPAAPGSARGAVPDWRTAAAWWVRREHGARADGLIRILDVREVAPREAWVSLEAGGLRMVAGLRHETVAGAAADDGWYRLLYLTVDGAAPTRERGA